MKKIILLIILSLILISISSPVFAADSASTKLKQTLSNGFKWIMGIAGLLAGISFAVGAVQYAVTDHAGGKERMLGSVLGMALILGSYIIIQTINPKITKLEITTIPGGAGIYYVKGAEKSPAPRREENTTTVFNEGYQQIKYECINNNIGAAILVWKYQKPNFKDADDKPNAITTDRITCGGTTQVPNSGSFKIEFETPGVYFYSKAGCAGEASEVKTSSQSPINEIFTPKSFRIFAGVGDAKIGFAIGVIMHENPDLNFGGLCDAKIYMASTGSGTGLCSNVAINPGAADIFMVPGGATSLGSGVTFYSEPTGWNKLEAAGSYKVENQTIANAYTGKKIMADQMKYIYSVNNRDSAYQKMYKTFKDKQGSIQINGNYIVGVFSKASGSRDFWCKTYKDYVENLGQEDALDPEFNKDPNSSQLFTILAPAKK